jgi:hypothetical protein
MRATRRTPGPATASGAWGRREIGAAGSIAYPARHAVARRAKAGRWADDAVARVVELVREDSLQATGRYTDVKNAIAEAARMRWGVVSWIETTPGKSAQEPAGIVHPGVL